MTTSTSVNNVMTITAPLVAGSINLAGVAGQTNQISVDTLAGTKNYSVITEFLQNNDGSLTVTLFDYPDNVTETLNLPALSATNAITQLLRLNSGTAQTNNVTSTFVLGGPNADYSNSSNLNLYIVGTATGNNVIIAPPSSSSVTQIQTGSGNDTITGSGNFSAMNGGGGANTLNGLGGTNNFRMLTSDNGTDYINALSGSTNTLAIYMPGSLTFPHPDDTFWNFKQVGTNIVGFVKDANGNISNFTINNMFASQSSSTPLLNFQAQVYGLGNTTIWGGGLDQLNSSSSGNEMFIGSSSSQTFDLTNVSGLKRGWVFGNGTSDIVKISPAIPTIIFDPIGSSGKVFINDFYIGYGFTSSYTPSLKNASSFQIQLTPPGIAAGSNTSDFISNYPEIDFNNAIILFKSSIDNAFQLPDNNNSLITPTPTIFHGLDLKANATITGGGGLATIYSGTNATINQGNGGYVFANFPLASTNYTITTLNAGPNGSISGFAVKDNTGVSGTTTIGLGVNSMIFNGVVSLQYDYTQKKWISPATSSGFTDIPVFLISQSSSSIAEGKTLTFNIVGVNAKNIPFSPESGMSMPYTLTGTGNASTVSTTGTLKLDASGVANISVTIPTNTVVGDTGTLMLTLVDGQKSYLVSVTDGTVVPSAPITLNPSSSYTALANQTINGTSGVNTVVFNEPYSNFTIKNTSSSTTLNDSIGVLGTDTLTNIQRLKFSDGTKVAIDFQTGQNSFNAAMMIGTAFGAPKLSAYFATALPLYDQGQSDSQVAALIEQYGLIETQLGISTNNTPTDNKIWIDFVYKNIIGTLPDAFSESIFIGYLNTTISRAQLLASAVGFAEGGGGTIATAINLTGIQTQGLLY